MKREKKIVLTVTLVMGLLSLIGLIITAVIIRKIEATEARDVNYSEEFAEIWVAARTFDPTVEEVQLKLLDGETITIYAANAFSYSDPKTRHLNNANTLLVLFAFYTIVCFIANIILLKKDK